MQMELATCYPFVSAEMRSLSYPRKFQISAVTLSG